MKRGAGDESSRSLRMATELRWLGALGILAATVLFVSANLASERFYHRFDVTRSRLYSLSAPTRETLAGLSERVQILVFMSRADPEIGAVERLLDQYRAGSSLVEVRYVDPERNPAQFIALKNRHRLTEGRTEAGRLVSDAAIVIVIGDARWVITPDDIVSYDPESDTATPRLESALTEGLRQLLYPQSRRVCVTRGHGEPSISDGGAAGLGAFRDLLDRNNYEVREVDLSLSSFDLPGVGCDLIVVAAPNRAFEAATAERLGAQAKRGTSLLIGVGPRLGEDQRVAPTGLAPALDPFGVAFDPLLVFERDPDLALPAGLGGEVFFATPRSHAITRGMLVAGEPQYRVLMNLSQAVTGGASSTGLLATSDRAFGVRSGAVIADGSLGSSDAPRDREGALSVARAAEVTVPVRGEPQRVRLVALGSASPLLGGTFGDPSLAGTRRFVESAVAWLTERPSLVQLPEKPGRSVGMALTDAALTEVARYVMLYMPLTALSLGVLILFRRRWSGRPRRGGPEAAE